MPGQRRRLATGVCLSLRGNVIGNLPDGLTSPNRTAAIALPFSWPGYHASTTPATLPIHGIRAAPPVLSTTTVLGLAAATALISRFWSPGSARLGLSPPSVRRSLTNTTATSALLAASTAACSSAGLGASQPTCTDGTRRGSRWAT